MTRWIHLNLDHGDDDDDDLQHPYADHSYMIPYGECDQFLTCMHHGRSVGVRTCAFPKVLMRNVNMTHDSIAAAI